MKSMNIKLAGRLIAVARQILAGPNAIAGILAEIAEIAKYNGGWHGWEWAHDPGGPTSEGPGALNDWSAYEDERIADIVASGEFDRTKAEEIAADERAYGERCQEDAESALDRFKEVRTFLLAGDFEAALEAASAAAALERGYGDAPTYGPLEKALMALVEDEDDLLEQLRDAAGAAGDDKQVVLCDAALDGDKKALKKCRDVLLDAAG